ncbi:proteasome activator complex subunit 4-like isoform X2 [Bacillus rossius redtenbacheri]
MSTSATAIGIYRYYSSLDSTLESLVRTVKPYFPLSATKEMFDEWRPMLCPFEVTAIGSAVETMEWFLPVTLSPEDSHLGYKLWFSELMALWEACHNCAAWEENMMWIMARLAEKNIGYIDWEPHMPLMFTRFLRSLSLPVYYKKTFTLRKSKLDTSAIALWIVSTLGGGSSAQKYLDKFLKDLDSYFHPANFGPWHAKLKELLRKLPVSFVGRLHSERIKKLRWQTPVPDSHKLTEDDITRFVESMAPVAMRAMFSRLGSTDVSEALLNLAMLRPGLIVPQVVDRMYTNLGSMTEPHKLTSAMQCVVAVARPMVCGQRLGHKEGPTHVVPLLLATLPGIDPNDCRKCLVTLHFVATFASMVPFVDSSMAPRHWQDLTEEEEVVCAATADFEDFVLQFLDRCFMMIENSSFEATRLERDEEKRSKLESVVENSLSSTINTLLSQTSPEIFKSALKKLHSFVTSRILESNVAGQFCASVCRVFARVNGKETLRMLVPYLCDTILPLVESEESLKEETLDSELLYKLLILSQVVGCPGSALVPYVPAITSVLDRTLHLTCRKGYLSASRLLKNLLNGLSELTPMEFQSLPRAFSEPISKYLPVRHWGTSGDIDNVNLKWYIPGEDEVSCVQGIISRYLTKELDTIDMYVKGELSLTREELHCSLNIIHSLLECKSLLPLWEEEPIHLIRGETPSHPFKLQLPLCDKHVAMPDGGNVRKTVVHAMDRLQEKMLKDAEDDIKSLFVLITIWESLMFDMQSAKGSFEMHWKSHHTVKKTLGSKLFGRNKHLRLLLIDRATLQHDMLNQKVLLWLTPTHRTILLDLMTLSTSHYSEVRSRAQNRLFNTFNKFYYSYSALLPNMLENLKKDSNQHHELFKGTLYVLLGPKQLPVVTRRDWGVLRQLFPALVRSHPSEKLSVIRLLENIIDTVHKLLPTITIALEFPDDCLAAARRLASVGTPVPVVAEKDVERGKALQEARNKLNTENYLGLLNTLLDIVQEQHLHWRFHNMAMSFIRDLVHPDINYPARIVKCILSTLTYDSLELRKIAIRSTMFVLKQQKRAHAKVPVDPLSLGGEPRPSLGDLRPGDRPDNRWVQYCSDTLPRSAESWDQLRYLHRPYHGFYTWPKEVKMYAPPSKQPSLVRSHEEMSPEEREVDLFFSNSENIDKLIGYFSLEEKKGKDKFNGYRFIMFKGLFRNFGDRHLKYFLPHLERLVADKHESSQRCAAEIIAGLIRGTKHWPFEMVARMWEQILPIIRTAQATMTEETIGDWGVCFATASEVRDPNRQHWLLEMLMEDPLRDEASIKDCGRLYTLQGALNQQEWRVAELFNRLLEYLKPYLTHPFQNVRERLGSVLTNIFETDLVIGEGAGTRSPHIGQFMSEITPQLEVLYQQGPEAENGRANHVVDKGVVQETKEQISEEEKDKAIRLLKTVCRWFNVSLTRAQYGAIPAHYQLFALVCLMESYDKDEEVGKSCSVVLSHLSQAIMLPRYIPAALDSFHKTSKSVSWCARLTCLDFMQVMVFHNMPTFHSSSSWVQQISDIVLTLLEDDWLEVRVKAAQVLGGLIHCDFISNPLSLLEVCKTKARTKLKKKLVNSAVVDPKSYQLLKIRHAGILGLCAFINAYPYDVPEFILDIFLVLGEHLNDPQPIPSTIRKTLGDFKRTHHDDWEQHSLRFTEQQLTVLKDLTIPPSYYA